MTPSHPLFPTPARLAALCAAVAIAALQTPLAQAQASAPMAHDLPHHHMTMSGAAPAAGMARQPAPKVDTRQVVDFPSAARRATLADMRSHLETMGEIQSALSKSEFELAAHLAENKLGLSSMHGDMNDSARYMPKRMREMGYAMHQSASQFAVAAQDASVGGDVRPALAALSTVTQNCVACHAIYRLK